jgi:beta-lactamase class A
MHLGRPALVGIALLSMTACHSRTSELLERQLQERIASSGGETVGLYFRNLDTGDTVLIDADVRLHAASTMKVPVLIQLFRDQDAGLLSLDDSTTITKTFRSIVDGSPYELGAPDDSDTTLYQRVGERETLRTLAELMITVSSNLATNMLIERVGAERTQATMRELGADSIAVLRGVEDMKAYERGLSNTTTARDLGVILTAIAEERAASAAATTQMLGIMLRQQFRDAIPAGLPPHVRVAGKDGWIEGITHDAGIVYLTDAPSYVLVVLTKGIAEAADARRLIADLSRLVYEHVVGT